MFPGRAWELAARACGIQGPEGCQRTLKAFCFEARGAPRKAWRIQGPGGGQRTLKTNCFQARGAREIQRPGVSQRTLKTFSFQARGAPMESLGDPGARRRPEDPEKSLFPSQGGSQGGLGGSRGQEEAKGPRNPCKAL